MNEETIINKRETIGKLETSNVQEAILKTLLDNQQQIELLTLRMNEMIDLLDDINNAVSFGNWNYKRN